MIRHHGFNFIAETIQQSFFGDRAISKIQLLANLCKVSTGQLLLRRFVDPVRHHLIGDHDSQRIGFRTHHFCERQLIQCILMTEIELRSIHPHAGCDSFLEGELQKRIRYIALLLQLHHSLFVEMP